MTPPALPRRLFLIDGYALVYRSFFALGEQQLTSSKGENTAIAHGALEFLRRFLARHKPEALAWVEDAGDSFRHEIFPEYKATRERLEPAQKADFDTGIRRVDEILKGYRIPRVALDGFEADDVIGTLAAKASAQGVEVVIVSGDKDFAQLVKPGVKILNPWHGRPGRTTEKWYDETNVHERLGVPANRVVDYLALLGDTSDNVPGVKGIGEKTAHALIERWGSLEDILAHAEEVEPTRARTALREYGDRGRLSKQLVTIRTDLDVDPDFSQLSVREPDWASLRDLFVTLEFRAQAAEAAARVGGTGASATNATAPAERPPMKCITISTPDAAATLAGRIRAAGHVTIATHTVPEAGAPAVANPIRDRLVGLALAVDEDVAYYLPFGHGAADDSTEPTLALGDVTPSPATAGPGNLPPIGNDALMALRGVIEDPSVRKSGHDVKRDLLMLRKEGVALAGMDFDVMIASYLLDPGRRSNALDALAIDMLQRPLPAYDEVAGKGKQRKAFNELPVAVAAEFAGARVAACVALRSVIESKLADVGARRLLDDVELPLTAVLADMEWTGIRVDVAWLHSLKSRFAAARRASESAIYTAAGEEFNINSNKQLAAILFEKLGLPVRKKTTTGPSTDASVLQQLADEGNELPALILEYREFAKLESTYLDTLPGLVNPATGRIHTSYGQAIAATGRLASIDPNLQNIPVRSEIGRDIRRGFVPMAGWKLLAADYSQIELRLLAHLSGDPVFVEAFEAGGDIHRQTAAIIFGVEPGDVTTEMRARAKTINFATIYGQGAHALSLQLKVEHAEAKAFIDTYFTRFAGVRAYLDSTVADAKARGYAETILGRRRYIPELQDRNFNIRAFGERTAQNSPIQGSAADLIKVAMIRIAAAISTRALRGRMLLQVHDELVFEVPPDEVDSLRTLVVSEMTSAVALRVPLVVDVGVGDNWVDAKA
jgi:DNA polymerase-1